MGRVGADIPENIATQGEETTIRVQREFDRDRAIAALVVAYETFLAIGDPFDRPTDMARCPGQQPEFRVEVVTRPEVSSHVPAQSAATFHRHIEHSGKVEARADDADTLALVESQLALPVAR